MLQLRKTKKVFANFPRGFWRFPTKFQLFKKFPCPRAEDRAIFENLRLRGQGQGLENVSARPRTSSRTPPLYKSPSVFYLSLRSTTSEKLIISYKASVTVQTLRLDQSGQIMSVSPIPIKLHSPPPKPLLNINQ